MNENLDPTDSSFTKEDFEIDKALRPLSFDDFAGQDQILNNLKVFVEACNQQNFKLFKFGLDQYKSSKKSLKAFVSFESSFIKA